MTNSTANTEDTSPYESFDSRKLHEAAERALNHHFGKSDLSQAPRREGLFSLNPDIDAEALLANASEDLVHQRHRCGPCGRHRWLTPLGGTGIE